MKAEVTMSTVILSSRTTELMMDRDWMHDRLRVAEKIIKKYHKEIDCSGDVEDVEFRVAGEVDCSASAWLASLEGK